MNPSMHLFQLQKIDSNLDRCRQRIQEITTILETDQAVKMAEDLFADARRSEHKTRESLRAAEENVRAIQTKISLSESNLYRGSIRNPKELQDLQSEIASLKRRLSSLEDEELVNMLALEDAEKITKESAVNLEKTKAVAITRHASLVGEKSQLEKSIDRLLAERTATHSFLTPEYIATYEGLRKQKRGIAVVQISDNSCTACGVSIRPAEVQIARQSQQLAFCSSCGRILYAG